MTLLLVLSHKALQPRTVPLLSPTLLISVMKEIQIFYFCENKKVPDPPSSKAHGESDNKLANLGQPMPDDCYLPPRKRKGIDMKTSFVIMQKKCIFTRKVLHLASF